MSVAARIGAAPSTYLHPEVSRLCGLRGAAAQRDEAAKADAAALARRASGREGLRRDATSKPILLQFCVIRAARAGAFLRARIVSYAHSLSVH